MEKTIDKIDVFLRIHVLYHWWLRVGRALWQVGAVSSGVPECRMFGGDWCLSWVYNKYMLVLLDVLEWDTFWTRGHAWHAISKVYPRNLLVGNTFENTVFSVSACPKRVHCSNPLTPPCFSLLNLNFAFGFDSKSRVKHHAYIYDTYLERP